MRNTNLAKLNCHSHILTRHNKGMISKGTVVSVHAKKVYGERGLVPFILDYGTRWR
jgi:hypothetical protein